MHRRGVTLIEALVAIALIATVLPVALAAVSEGARGISAAQRRELLLRVAEGRLARLLADGSWTTASGGGDCDPALDGEDAAGLRWTLAVEPWRDPVVRRLHLTVQGLGHSVALETLAVPGGTP